MDQDLKKLKKMVKFMRKEGILSLKLADIELNLSQAALFEAEPKTTTTETPEPDQKQYTDEEILMWSAPGYVQDNQETN